MRRNLWWKILSDAIRERDDHQCKRCGATPEIARDSESVQATIEKSANNPKVLNKIVRNLAVHHLFPEKKVPDEQDPRHPSNLVTLCRSCHKSIENRNIGKQLSACNIDDIEDLELSVEMRRRLRREIRRRIDEPGTEIGELPSPTIEFLCGVTDQTQIEDFLIQDTQSRIEYETQARQAQKEQSTFSIF